MAEDNGRRNRTEDRAGGMEPHTREHDDEEQEMSWLQHFGDERERGGNKDETIVRIATMNINSYPCPGTTKSLRLKEETQHIECIGLSEINKNWCKVPSQASIYNRTLQQWPHQKHQVSWLYDPAWPSEFQKGGVSLTLTNHKLAKYGIAKGEDTEGLGRWAWHTVEGHDNVRTVIIQTYRPNRNHTDNGSTFVQQQVASGFRNPIKKFDDDLLSMIDEFIETQHQVIVMGDFNIPLKGTSKLEKALAEKGIYDVMQQQYSGRPPATHKRGSAPIDAIFISETLQMIRGGYDGGKDEISDHRMIWADITMDSLLGIDRGDIIKPKAKKLQAKNRVRVMRFNRALLKQIRLHRILHKARELEAEVGSNTELTKDQEQRYEGIDTQRCRAVAYAENACVKLPPNEMEFSGILQAAIGIATLWNLIKRKARRNKRIHKRWLINTKKRLGVTEHIDIPNTLEGVVAEENKAKQTLKNAQRKAPELRSEFLDLLMQQAEEAGDIRKYKDLKQIKEAENTRDVHKRIKVARGKLRGGGVRFVHAETGEGGGVTTVKDKYQMEEMIMKANAAKLQAANDSPVRQGELGTLITDSDYSQWEKLLNGTIQLPTTIEAGTRRWIEYFRQIPLPDIDIPFTTEDYVRSWRPVKEHTSCAPGALHFGTFKTMHLCRPAAELHTILARIPMQTGYIPKRWTRSVDSMLPKKKDEWRPQKLRLTSLLMPDFNHNNKILGRAAMQQAEQAGALAPEQYGSRKHHSASKHALNKRLVLDALRIQRRPGVIIANDAKSCYDRILHVAAYLALRRAGLKKEAVRSMLEPIRRMQHKIRTAYGDSTLTYGGEEWERDPSGICQGNGAGPAIWALVSSPLLDILRNAGHGAQLHAAIGDTFLELAGFAFVDDTDIIKTGELDDTTQDLILKAQTDLDMWEELVRATGGGIAGEKSDFAVVNFKWNRGRWKYEVPDTTNKLTVRDGQGNREALTQLHPKEARRTLGIWQAVDGNEKEQTKVMKEKATEWSRAAARSSLTRSDVMVGIKTSLYPSLTFGMMATTLTEQQCKEVFKPVRKGVLPKAGYSRNIPHEVLHGPTKYGGINIKDLYTIQGTEHIKVLMEDGGKQTPTGQLLDINASGHVLEIGRSGQLFSMKYDEVHKLMTDSWVKHTLQYISHNKIEIQSTGPTLRTWRQGDRLLMDMVHDADGIVPTEDLLAFNRCRMHLKVTTWSDICTASGEHVLHDAWECKQTWTSASKAAYKWPRQPRPCKGDIRVWQNLLQLVFNVGARYLSTSHQMGAMHNRTRSFTKWLFSATEDSLYQRRDHGWQRWRRVRQRTRTAYFEPTLDMSHQMRRNWEMAVVTKEGSHRVRHEGNVQFGPNQSERMRGGEGTTPEPPHHRPATLERAIKAIPYSLQWTMENITMPKDEGKEIAAMIIRGKARCTSDGSLKDNFGTSAALSMNHSEDNGYRICNRTPGRDEDQSSFRSELCGILTNIVMMNQIAIFHSIETGSVELACDNESALWVSFGTTHVNTGDSSFDLIQVIKNEIQKSPFTWDYRHVKGHQDDEEGIVLDEWARANIEADAMAEAHWTLWYEGRPRERPQPPRMPGEGWRLTLNGCTVAGQVDTTIHEHVYYTKMMKYWEYKERIAQGVHGRVAWNHYQGAINLLPRAKQQWVTKHHCGFEGNNHMLFKWKRRLNPWCPMCAEVETHRHVLQCQSAITTEVYEAGERKLGAWLRATTSQDMKRAVLTHLRAYRDKEQAETADHWDQELQAVSNDQVRLGPNAFAEGLLSTQWVEIQKQVIENRKGKQDPGRWIHELIKRMWMICRDIWDQRNARVHQHAATKQAIITAQLHSDITDAHAKGRDNVFLQHLERVFFRQSLNSVLQQTDYQKRIWLHLATRYLERDRLRVAQSRSTQIMREFLRPGSTAEVTRNRTRIRNRHIRDFQARPGMGRPTSGRHG